MHLFTQYKRIAVIKSSQHACSLRFLPPLSSGKIPSAVLGDGRLSSRTAKLLHAAVPMVYRRPDPRATEQVLGIRHFQHAEAMLPERLAVLSGACFGTWHVNAGRAKNVTSGIWVLLSGASTGQPGLVEVPLSLLYLRCLLNAYIPGYFICQR